VAATTQIAAPATRSVSPLALWHLCSLDAPTVAALWTWFIARASHVRLPPAAPIAMALAVWILYAADRLLDARHRNDPCNELEARHFFHLRHRRAFLVGIALSALALAAVVPRLPAPSIHLYLVEGALLTGWFLVLHATPVSHRLPKEIAVGLFFAAAVFIPTVARQPALRPSLLPVAALFTALCGLNCLFIYAWEHETPGTIARPAHPTTRLALAHLPALTIVTATAGAALSLLHLSSSRLIPAACALAALSLFLLDRNRRQFSRTNLRAAADLALLTPILLLPFLR
jgi:hypothetical protein